jgi:hypothetical protein
MFGILSLAVGLEIVSHSHRRILKCDKRFSFAMVCGAAFSICFDFVSSKKN